MKSWLCCIGLVAVMASAACGDDTNTTGGAGAGGTGGSGGGAGASGSGGGGNGDGGTGMTVGCVTVYDADKITYTGSAAPTYTCDANKSTKYPDGPNACRNASDCAIINTGQVRDLVRVCALGCRTDPPNCTMEASCNATCVKDATATKIMMPGLNDACGKCYTDIALCSAVFCLSECAANADAIDCVKCQFASGCRVPFERCSGVDRQE